MFWAEIGTAGVISAYFFRHFNSCYSLNVSDPNEGQPVQLSDYLFVFGCGLVFWLLVLLRAKLHGSGDRQADIRKVAKGGGSGTNRKQAFNSSKITEISLMLTAQTIAALIGFRLMTPSSSSKALLVVVLIDRLVAYLCGLTSILLSSNKPAAEIFAKIGVVCTVLGFILTVAMFMSWYFVLMPHHILFWNRLVIFVRGWVVSRGVGDYLERRASLR